MKTRICFLLILVFGFCETQACTTFLISGKVTPDGRPILYKHRDTDQLNNALAYFKDGKYDYIGVVNGDANWSKEVWGGYNETGFAIINSMAYNNNIGDTTQFKDQEGVLMKLALQTCRTLKDFEELLRKHQKPMGVDANFGVIDAYGGAAYYETGNFNFVKYDVNDISVAPQGFLIRTNHSFNNHYERGYGYTRYNTAMETLKTASESCQLLPHYLLDHISRNLTHSLTRNDLWNDLPEDRSKQDMHFFIDFIPRGSSASVMMIIGATDENHAYEAMMWTILGFPLTSVAIPTWIHGGSKLPEIVTLRQDFHAPLCDAALQLKKNCFPMTRGEGNSYINLAAVINRQNTGYLQMLEPLEKEIFNKVDSIRIGQGTGQKVRNDIRNLYQWLDGYLDRSYRELFEIKLLNTQ